MSTTWVEDELKKRLGTIYSESKNPEIEDVIWIKDEEASKNGFGFTDAEIKKWVQAGLLSKTDGEVILKDFEASERRRKATGVFVENCKREGREPSNEELVNLLISEGARETTEDLAVKLNAIRYIEDHRVELLKFLDPTKPKKFRQSGHLVDQKLKLPTPIRATIFERLSPDAQGKIEGYEIKTIGIQFTPSEDKLINALMCLLQKNSNHHNSKATDFYMGNEEMQLVPYGSQKSERMPVIRCTLPEICKTYLGQDEYSGSELEHTKTLLFELEKKKFLILYDRKRKVDGKPVTDRIEDVRGLYKIIRYYEGMTHEETKAIDDGNLETKDQKGELIIGFCPLLIDQIDKKYVEYPEDINRRMIVAAGGFNKVTSADNQLRDYLMRERSNKRYRVQINEDNLIQILGLGTYKAAGRKTKVQQRIQSAIQTSKNLGLLIAYIKTTGVEGQWKYEFEINKDFE